MEIKKSVIVEKIWGFEEIYANSDKYCGKRLVIQMGGSTSIHSHGTKTETFTPILGNLNVDLYQISRFSLVNPEWINPKIFETIHLKSGETLTLRPNTIHRLYPDQDDMVVLLEFSTKHDDNDTKRYK